MEVARAAFLGLRRGAANGDWGGFLGVPAEDARLMIPLPASGDVTGFEGPNVGLDRAREVFRSHREERNGVTRLACKRIVANGPLIVFEARIEGERAHFLSVRDQYP